MASVLEPSIDRDPQPESSDRGFGVVFAVVFVLVGCWPLLGSRPLRWWALAIAAAFAIVAVVQPRWLRPLNWIWLRLGRLLHRVVSPLVMGMIFFVVVTPTGLIMRWLGNDLLNRKWHSDQQSYWIKRDPPLPASKSMPNQF